VWMDIGLVSKIRLVKVRLGSDSLYLWTAAAVPRFAPLLPSTAVTNGQTLRHRANKLSLSGRFHMIFVSHWAVVIARLFPLGSPITHVP
jgi:hypothetical protein